MQKINVLSLFGGIEVGKLAINVLSEFAQIDQYFSSESDPYPRSVAEWNHPDIIHIGNVEDVRYYEGSLHTRPMTENPDGSILESASYHCKIDLLIGGPPCQDLSAAKKNGKGLE